MVNLIKMIENKTFDDELKNNIKNSINMSLTLNGIDHETLCKAKHELLMWCCEKGRLDVIHFIEDEFGLTNDDVIKKTEHLYFSCGYYCEYTGYKSITGYKSYDVAAYNGYFEIVRYLVKKYKSIISDIKRDNIISLDVSIMNGHNEIAKYLIEKLDLTINDIRKNHTIIGISCQNGNLDIIRYLKKMYPQLNACDFFDKKNTKNPFFRQVMKMGHLDLLQYLIDEIGVSCDDIITKHGANPSGEYSSRNEDNVRSNCVKAIEWCKAYKCKSELSLEKKETMIMVQKLIASVGISPTDASLIIKYEL